MKVSKKLELFRGAALTAAEGQLHQRHDEIEAAYNEACEGFRRRLQGELDAAARDLEDEARRQSAEAIRKAHTQSRRELAALRDRLAAGLWDNVREMLSGYVQTAEYARGLTRDIAACAAEYGRVRVLLHPRDLAAVNPGGDIEAEAGAEDMLGGFVAIADGGRIVIDNSYRRRLEEAQRSFNGLSIAD